MPKENPEKRLTIRQRKYINSVAKAASNGGEIKKGKLLREAGYSKSASEKPSRVEMSENVRAAMKIALEKEGLGDRQIAKIIVEAANATRNDFETIRTMGKKYNPATKRTETFESVETREVVRAQHDIRLRAADLAGKFRGDFVERIEGNLSHDINMGDSLEGLTEEEIKTLAEIRLAQRKRTKK